YNSPHFQVKGATFVPAPMLKVGAVPPPGCGTPGTATQSIYLPNITRYLGGPTGWYTPFIVQNTGSVATTLEVSFYKFTDGSLITRRFFGFDTPFIIQNLGTQQTAANATFVSFDGTVPSVTSLRVIDPGRSQFIDPNYEPGLVDGHQYSVTVTALQPISVVVNT